MKIAFLFSLSLLCYTCSSAQMMSYTDPGMAYSKIILEKGAGTYRQIGNFKVQGSPYLYGELINGIVYTPDTKGVDVQFRVDNYNKNLEIKTDSKDQFMIKPVAEIDSFILKAGIGTYFSEDLHFLNSAIIDSTKSFFLQQVFKGPGYSLYKAYTTTLGVVSTNYIQGDLRQFDLNVEYYYTAPYKGGLKKLKLTKSAIKKEFNNVAVSDIIEQSNFAANPEKVLQAIFLKLNFSNN